MSDVSPPKFFLCLHELVEKLWSIVGINLHEFLFEAYNDIYKTDIRATASLCTCVQEELGLKINSAI